MSYQCIRISREVFNIEACRARYMGGNSNIDSWVMQDDRDIIYYVRTYCPDTFLKYIVPKEFKI